MFNWDILCRAPVQYTLPQPTPPPQGALPCQITAEPCWLYLVGSGVQMRMAMLACNASMTTDINFAAAIVYNAGNTTGWLAVTPTGGTAMTSTEIPLMCVPHNCPILH